MQIPLSELQSRLARLRVKMDATAPEWNMVVIFSKINLLYFTGTMQEGMLLIPRNDEAILWVRRSYERATEESFFPVIKPMNSYRDAALHYKAFTGKVHLETEVVPLAMYQRFQKYFTYDSFQSVDSQIGAVRAVKSPFEIDLMKRSGVIHQHVLEDLVPGILKEGISEADFSCELYRVLVAEGHQGTARFAMFDTEMAVGQIAFGENSIYPTSFNGPGGNFGMSPSAPLLGSRSRKLQKGDLVFVDAGCGVEGYHTDKTMTYMFGASLPDEAIVAHLKCVDIQNKVASMLTPGAIPSQIYETVLADLDPSFLDNFMGYGNRQVKFLGHGIGLTIDETPVIAQGFDEPLQDGMAFAIEPKKGVQGIGMVGIENTFLVTPGGGLCITGNNPGLILVE